MSLRTFAIATSAFACATLLSFGWSEQSAVSLSVESAQCGLGGRVVQCSSTTSCYFFLPEPIVGCHVAVF